MPAPPTVQKVNPADQPILFMGLSSNTLSLPLVDEYAETIIAPRISTLSGVAQVNVFGAMTFAVRVQVDPNQLASRGIGIDEVQGAINKHNVNLPSGTLWGPHQAFTVEANGQVMNADAYRPLIVTYRNGSPVRLGEIATVVDSVQDTRNFAWYNNKRAIMFQIQRQPGTNTVEVVDRIKSLLPEFREILPPAVTMDTVYDRSESIRESVNDVKLSIGAGHYPGCSGDLRIPAECLRYRHSQPGSASFGGGHIRRDGAAGIHARQSFADGAHARSRIRGRRRHRGAGRECRTPHGNGGKTRMQAALEGGREIAFTILSMTLSLAAVFIPVLFMGGIIGRLFHEFAVVIMVSILISGFVSLSLTPMLCSRFLKPPNDNHNALFRASERVFDGFRDAYGWTLRHVVRHRFVTLMVAVGTLVATVYLYRVVPTGFIPNQDTGQIQGTTELPQDASFYAKVKSQSEAAAIVQADPNVEGVFSTVNASGGNNGANAGRIFMRLKPRTERKLTPEQIIDELRPRSWTPFPVCERT